MVCTMCATKSLSVKGVRKVHAPNITLFGARTERTLEHFSIRQDLASRAMIAPYATLKISPTSIVRTVDSAAP